MGFSPGKPLASALGNRARGPGEPPAGPGRTPARPRPAGPCISVAGVSGGGPAELGDEAGFRQRRRAREDRLYVPIWAGFVFPAVVLDVYSRRIVGWWAMQDHLRTELVLEAMNMAVRQRRP